MSNQNQNQSLTHQYINVVSTNQAAWGSYCYIDLNLVNYCIHDVVLQISLSAISGITPNAALFLPAFAPAYKFVQNIAITNNNNMLDQVDGQYNYLMNVLYTSQEDSAFIHTAAGFYNNQQQRYNLSIVPTTFQIPLKSYFSQIRPEILHQNSSIRIAILLDNLVNIINQGAIVGTPIVTINNISALCKVTKYSNELVANKLIQLSRNPLLKTYNTVAYQPFVIQANQSTATISLSNFVGQQIQFVYFVIKPSANLNRAESFIYQPLTSYNVLSSSGESITAGLILSSQSLYVYGRTMSLGNILCDSTYGNIYSWFHSSDPISTITQAGGIYGSRVYNGSETLVLNFPLTLVPLNVDIYASCSSIHKQTGNGSFVKIVV